MQKQTNEWDKATLPIAFGGFRILGALLTIFLAILFGAWTNARVFGGLLAAGNSRELLWLGKCAALSCVGCVALIGLWILRQLGISKPLSYLHAYYDRNVRGYTVYYFLGAYDIEDESLVGKLCWEVRKRGEGISFAVHADSLCLAALPLGGWFARAHIQFGERTSKNWSVVPPMLPLRELVPYRVKVRVVDKNGNHVTLTIVHALRAIIDGRSNWEAVIETHNLRKERIVELTSEREQLRNLVLKAINDIDASKRFVQSKSGRAIRIWLDDSLRILWPEYRARRQQEEQEEVHRR